MADELFKNYGDLLSVDDLVEMLSISRVLAYKLITTGKLNAVKIGREYKIAKVNVIAFVMGGR